MMGIGNNESTAKPFLQGRSYRQRPSKASAHTSPTHKCYSGSRDMGEPTSITGGDQSARESWVLGIGGKQSVVLIAIV